MTIDSDINTKATQVVEQSQIDSPAASTWDDFFFSTPSATDDFMVEHGNRNGREIFEALVSIELPEDFPDEIPPHPTRP